MYLIFQTPVLLFLLQFCHFQRPEKKATKTLATLTQREVTRVHVSSHKSDITPSG